MLVDAVKRVKQAMFPIFKQKVLGQQTEIGVVGTGYFIDDKGHFVTTAHCFDGASPDTKYLYLGLLPDNLLNPHLEIKEVSRDDQYDILLGHVDLTGNAYLGFSSLQAEIGRTVCISGYPLASITINSQGGIEVGGVRRYFQPSFILDINMYNSMSETGQLRIHDGYLIRDIGLFGMSGGPVVDVYGSVIGMQASVTKPRESISGDRKIIVENAVAIRKERIIAELTARGIGYNLVER